MVKITGDFANSLKTKMLVFLSKITEKFVTKQLNCQFYHLTKLKTINKKITN